MPFLQGVTTAACYAVLAIAKASVCLSVTLWHCIENLYSPKNGRNKTN